jgi:hypothetical protein
VSLGSSKKGATHMSLTQTEFAVLRATIATRGTVRMALLPITVLGWAALTGALLLFAEVPVAVIFPLAVLVSGFEAIHALHVGVERIGRYLQVNYESLPDAPQWESTAMRIGPALPGGGIDPLFTVVFMSTTFANLIPAATLQPTRIEFGILAMLHIVFIIRLVRARGAAARQRAVDLETFKAIKSQAPVAKPSVPEM